MAEAMPARVFNHWRHYYMIEPFGAWRDDYHAATQSAIIANVNRAKGSEPYRAEDFMFMDAESRAEHEAEKSAQQMAQFISGLDAKAEGQKRERKAKANGPQSQKRTGKPPGGSGKP
jgi:hypothetical protein